MADIALRVLVVDDERFFREAICDALAADSIECEVAASGDEALRVAESAPIGVVVLDLQLGGKSGLDVLRRLHAERPDVRVIVLSAHSAQEDVLEALRLHACDYLAKPLHDEELVLSVRRALEAYATETGFRRLRARLHALDAWLSDLSARARGGADVEQIALRAVEAVADVLGASKTSLLLLDEPLQELRVLAALGSELAPEEMEPVAVGQAVAGLALERDEPIVAEDVEKDERLAGRLRSDRYRSRSLAVMPFRFGSLRGVLCATDRDGSAPFGDEDRALLRSLAQPVAALLAAATPEGRAGPPAPAPPARPADAADAAGGPEARPDEVDAELLRAVCDAMTDEVEPERLIHAVLRAVAAGLPAAPVSLYLTDASTGRLALEGQCDREGRDDRPELPARAGLTASVLQTGRLVATDHPEIDPRFEPAVDTPEDGEVGPLLCVPVRLRGKTLGVLRAFPGAGASARTGELLAAAVSAAVRNVLLYRSLLESIEDVARARREHRA